MAFRVLPWWLFIAGDTLRHQPMGTGHMTVLQLCGLMEFRVLQWCHPMLASTRRTSCCTRIITLYGARKWVQARTACQTLLMKVKFSFRRKLSTEDFVVTIRNENCPLQPFDLFPVLRKPCSNDSTHAN